MGRAVSWPERVGLLVSPPTLSTTVKSDRSTFLTANQYFWSIVTVASATVCDAGRWLLERSSEPYSGLKRRPCSGVIIAPDLSRQGYFDDAGFAQAYATPDAYPAAMTFKNSL
jgi:hypothetical protein